MSKISICIDTNKNSFSTISQTKDKIIITVENGSIDNVSIEDKGICSGILGSKYLDKKSEVEICSTKDLKCGSISVNELNARMNNAETSITNIIGRIDK